MSIQAGATALEKAHGGRGVLLGGVPGVLPAKVAVIGEPVNEAARLCELAKSVPGHLAASADMLGEVSESERANWTLGDTVTLRGLSEPTQLAILA